MKSLIPFLFSTALVLMFQSCGPVMRAKEQTRLTDPAFVPYVQEFEYLSKMDVSFVIIAFADLPDDQAGVCHLSVWDNKIVYSYIEIDREYWPRASELQKINLIYHELGHCALRRDHTPVNSVMMCPSSFMNWQIMNQWCLEQNWQAYVTEMFGDYDKR